MYLLVAICLFLGVCGYCYPDAGMWTRAVIAGAEDSPVREAFNVLSDGLEEGLSIRDAAKSSVSALIDRAD